MKQRLQRVGCNIFYVKLAILCFFFVGFVAVLLTDNSAIETTQAFSFGPPPGHTGAPSEQTCSSCHTQSPPTGQFTIIAPQSYELGQTYQITVQHTTNDTSRRRWGFQLTGLTTENNRVGNLQSISNITTVTEDEVGGGIRQYIQHNSLGTFAGQPNGATWMFNWTAPSSNAGPVTFYAGGLQANNNGSPSGDQTYTTMVTVAPAGTPTEPIRVVLSRDGSGQLQATITITNPLPDPVPGVQLTSVRASTLDGSAFVDGAPVPQSFGTINPGQSVVAMVVFPGTEGVPSGFAGLVRVDLSFTGGTYSETKNVVTP